MRARASAPGDLGKSRRPFAAVEGRTPFPDGGVWWQTGDHPGWTEGKFSTDLQAEGDLPVVRPGQLPICKRSTASSGSSGGSISHPTLPSSLLPQSGARGKKAWFTRRALPGPSWHSASQPPSPSQPSSGARQAPLRERKAGRHSQCRTRAPHQKSELLPATTAHTRLTATDKRRISGLWDTPWSKARCRFSAVTDKMARRAPHMPNAPNNAAMPQTAGGEIVVAEIEAGIGSSDPLPATPLRSQSRRLVAICAARI